MQHIFLILAVAVVLLIACVVVLAGKHKAVISKSGDTKEELEDEPGNSTTFEDDIDSMAQEFANELDKYRRMLNADPCLRFIIQIGGHAPKSDEYYKGVKDDRVITTKSRDKAKLFSAPELLLLAYETLKSSNENVTIIPFRWEELN
ncbi:MAG: hypothetical protein IKR54_03005 [Lachnospiraceae bacterium]|nr:hypothetical protein [Lachnospiraceae bacterium]